jgi:LPXTG-motif cell wall-anchored protein
MEVGHLPQTDTAATLQLLIGLIALGGAAMFASIARVGRPSASPGQAS